MSKKTKNECASCGSELDVENDGLWAEGYKTDVCQECFYDIVVTCQLCRKDDVMPSDVSEFILVKAELARTAAKPPGIYRIRSRPFLSIPVIGSGGMYGNDVIFVDKLPKADCQFEISGHVCKDCAKPHRQTFEAVYGSGEVGYQKPPWLKEKSHTRAVILANSDMLRDLECDKHEGYGDFAGLKKHYDLPDLPTFHEWVFLKFGGVKVFRTCMEGRSAWYALKPDPIYRRTYPQGIVFAASGLPTWEPVQNEKFPKYSSYYDTTASLDREAMKAAIRAGMLTQNGVFDADGNLMRCG